MKVNRMAFTLRPALIVSHWISHPSFSASSFTAGSIILVRSFTKSACCFGVASMEVAKSSTVYLATPVDLKRVNSSSNRYEYTERSALAWLDADWAFWVASSKVLALA